MYKAIIVDDEEEVRSGIVNKIDWGRHGFVISGQAENGREALDMIEEDTPDVVITDITMPLMDGLQLAAAVRERFPTVKTAILTGFDDFKFAQQAIKYGVADYLLKPVLPSDIDALMAKLRQQLDSEIAQREDIDRLRRHYIESLPVIREQFLSSLVTGGLSAEGIHGRASALGLRLEGSVFLAAAVRIDAGSLAGNPLGSEDTLAAFAVMNIAREILEKHGLGEAFFHGGDLAVVASFERTDKPTIVNRAMAVLEEIRLSVEKYLRITVTIGMGALTDGTEGLRESYRAARSALEYRVLIGGNRVIYSEDIEPGRESRIVFDEERERQLASSIKFGGEKEVAQAVGLLFGDLVAAQASYQDCQLFFLEMLAAVSRVARVFEYDLEGGIGSPTNPYLEILKFSSLTEARAWYERLCLGLARHVESMRQNSTQVLLERAKEYITDHYADNELSIQKLADHLHISSSYLSMIFKKEAGETFLKHLVRVRLDAARELLDNTELKSTEIAERIGYPDINYFSYFFKKNFGMSPREYRNRAKS